MTSNQYVKMSGRARSFMRMASVSSRLSQPAGSTLTVCTTALLTTLQNRKNCEVTETTLASRMITPLREANTPSVGSMPVTTFRPPRPGSLLYASSILFRRWSRMNSTWGSAPGLVCGALLRYSAYPLLRCAHPWASITSANFPVAACAITALRSRSWVSHRTRVSQGFGASNPERLPALRCSTYRLQAKQLRQSNESRTVLLPFCYPIR
jgi:hypothetical protein